MPELINGPLFSDATLLAYWRLEGNSNDSKGSDNGTDTTMSYAAGYYGQCGVFNGSGYITYANILDNATNFTFNAWISKETANTTTDMVYFKNDCLMLGNYDGSNYFRFRVKNGSGWNATADEIYPFTANTWHMITGTFDANGGADNLKLYFDGVIWHVGTKTGTTGVSPDGGNFVLGGRSGNYFVGKIDDVAIWTKTLSATEIASLYDKTSVNYLKYSRRTRFPGSITGL